MSIKNEILNDKFELINCPVCGSNSLKLYFDILYGQLKQKESLDYSCIGVTKESRLYVKRCFDCGFVFVNPRIKKKYETLVYNESKKNMYRHTPYLTAVGIKENKNITRKKKLRCLKTFIELMKNQDMDKDLTLLDFGCGFGHSMSLGREFGMDVYGVDVDKKRLAVCKEMRLKVATSDKFDGKYPSVKADIIIFQNCIEHVVDLASVMNFIKEKSNDNAVIWVNGLTPRKISIEKKKGTFDKAHFIEHINFFPIKTLDLFFAKYSFVRIPDTINYSVKTFKDLLKLTLKVLFPESVSAYYFGGFSRMYRYKA